MPSSIPYDPSLILGSIVDTGVVRIISQISKIQARTDAAQEEMNSYVMMRRSLAMTLNELIDMGIDTSALNEKIKDVNQSITDSATGYLTARIENEVQIQQLKKQLYASERPASAATPVDFSQSKITTLPLSAESIKMDIQYFNFGSNNQKDTLATIENYIKSTTSDLGSKSAEVTQAVSAQVTAQLQNHNVAGTLIIAASCLHRNVSILDPLVLNVDNAVDIWNSLQSDPKQRFELSTLQQSDFQQKSSDAGTGDTISAQTDSAGSPAQPVPSATANETDTNAMTLLSGVAYGSSFVGMVHILKTDTLLSDVDDNAVQKMQEKLRLGGWLQNATGGVGIDPATLDQVKRVLSTQTFASHISVVCMGATPSIAAGEVKVGLTELIDTNTQKSAELLNALNQVTAAEVETVNTEAKQAKTAARLMVMQQANTMAITKGLSEVDQATNRMLDINTLMAAFNNYLKAVQPDTSATGEKSPVGVPVSYFYKRITRFDLLKKVYEKYKNRLS